MIEVHSGVCAPHMNGYVLAKKILRAGYYWLTMERDSIRFVRKCHECHIHSDLIHSPPSELHAMSAPWPFVAWGMDVIGPIEPKASNGHRFILVVIDYFTKWVEAVTFKSLTKKVVVDFIHFNIICRFGIPKVIITDNAANPNSRLMQEVCYQFKIEHRNSTLYRPKANWAVEATNKNIKKILRKMVQSSQQWHEKLPFALLGYRTTVRTSVGATPYSLLRAMNVCFTPDSNGSIIANLQVKPVLLEQNMLCVSNDDKLRREILNEAHTSPYAMHPGASKGRTSSPSWFTTALVDARNHDAMSNMGNCGQANESAHFIAIRMDYALERFAKLYINEIIMRVGQKGKLSPGYIGPYDILERVSPVAYKLALPPDLDKIHSVFHVSMLKRYRSDLSHVLLVEPIEVNLDLTYNEEPMIIQAQEVKQLINKRIH
ncbi:uncharacterized protein LOC107023421 [Solanum pennellii]|uniref:Uncharacterized protein LOC107023421 n=1 Tax=Solanum pennellii TaxID=28526 RepID=A0ABM1H2V8_SOLPN|nr:uncharacterized protein LOC107023421 [Solanum pennellii]